MEAAGFAAAIVAFIDFSCKIVKGSYELYQSQTGESEDYVHIETVVKDLAEVTKGLGPASALIIGPTPRHRHDLQQLALACQKVAEDLTAILEDLKRKDGNKTWRSLEAKWKAMRKEPAIASLEKRLDQFQSRIMMRLQFILEEKQDALHAQIEAMAQSDIRNSAATTHELRKVSTAIQNLETRIAIQLDTEDQHDSITELVAQLRGVLQNLTFAPVQTPAEIRVLNRLYFKTMFSRQATISDAFYRTFQWFLDDELPTLSDEYADEIFGQVSEERRLHRHRVRVVGHIFLELRKGVDDQIQVYQKFQHWLNTGGCFHISGKAGSGKSTLMRCLVEDPRLMTRLEQWAGSKKLIFASFFFSRLGDDDQKSLSGFYRSILFSVLEKCSDLIKDVFPTAVATPERPGSRWQDRPFSNAELRHALDILVSNDASTTRLGDRCFCFFVDGLDEYDGDSSEHFELAEQLKRWATSPAIRLCISSRPHIEFLDVFDDDSRIHLHQATSLDILRLIHGEFRKANLLEHLMEDLLTNDSSSWILQSDRLVPVIEVGPLSDIGGHDAATAFNLMARELLARANGVFLWVTLAIKTILHGKRHRCSMKRLQENIRKLPADLGTLFDQMLLGIRSEDKQLSAKLLLLATSHHYDAHRRNLTLLMVSFIDQLDDADFPLSAPVTEILKEEVEERLETGRCLLQSLTMGLFEYSKDGRLELNGRYGMDRIYWDTTISATHLTVLEYMREPSRRQKYNIIAGNFDVYDAFIRLRLAALLFYPSDATESAWTQIGTSRTQLGIFFDPGIDGSGQMSLARFNQVEAILCRKLGIPDKLVIWEDRVFTKIVFSSNSVIEGATSRRDARQHVQSPYDRHPLLYMAALAGQVDSVIALVRADPALLSQNENRMHLLCTAVKGNNFRLAGALLESGISPMEHVVVSKGDDTGYSAVPILAVFLRLFYYSSGLTHDLDWKARVDGNCHVLSTMLESTPDLDIIFMVETGGRDTSGSQIIAFSLESVIKPLNPSNLEKLLSQIQDNQENGGGAKENRSPDLGLDGDSGSSGVRSSRTLPPLREVRLGDLVLGDCTILLA